MYQKPANWSSNRHKVKYEVRRMVKPPIIDVETGPKFDEKS